MISLIIRHPALRAALACSALVLAQGSTLSLAADSSVGVPLSNEQMQSRQRIAGDLEYLSSDALKGRDTGSQEIDVAADYIAERFRSLGFNTELFDGQPFQEFTALREVDAGSAEENYLKITPADATEPALALELNAALRPLAIGGSGDITAPLVFAGFGITAPESNYDDYAGLDVKGKIVIIIRGEPRRGRDDNPFGTREASRYAFFTTKVTNAIEHGAAAVLMVNHAEAAKQAIEGAEAQLRSQKAQLDELDRTIAESPESATNVREQLQRQRELVLSQMTALETEVAVAPQALLATSQAGQAANEQTIPVVALGRIALDQILGLAANELPAKTIADLEQKIADDFTPHSFEIGDIQANLKATIATRDVRAKNVVAELPGRGDLANETVVIGAHYDHVGMGGAGLSLAPGTVAIHNGADDNGSGTCTLLETAHRLAQDQSANRRRIVFIAFTAEERGLLGSKHYAREPRFALEDTVGMINLDMVGRLNDDEQLTVFGTGTAPEFDSLVDTWNEKHKLPIRKDPSGYGPSDHTSFYEKNVPVLFFFTGLHSDYHRPTDDFDKINLDGMVRITDMVCDAAMYLATVAERPQYQTTGPGEGVRPSRRAFLGVTMENAEEGVKVVGLVEGGPAASAGLKVDDYIIKLGDAETSRMEEIQDAVGSKRAGDEVTVVLRRGGDEITVTVKLGRRP